jgi:type II secretory ATPase GspE/PulE/Tfp pilus assembly ATPase PilB-like protein
MSIYEEFMADLASQQGVDQSAPPGRPKKQRIGETLVALGLITIDQLDIALREQERTTRMLGVTLIDLGFMEEAALNKELADAAGVERFDAEATLVDPDVARLVPKDVASEHGVLPFSINDGTALVAMKDPNDVVAQDVLRQYLPPGTVIRPWMGAPADLAIAIDRAFGYEMSIDGILNEMDTGQMDATSAPGADEGYSHPVVRLVNSMLLDAVKLGASDLHFEPAQSFVRLRYRVDGVLYEIRTLHKDYWAAISQRIKIMSDMNIADKFNPQDGRFNFTFGNHEIDFRVSALPTIHGENLVLRVLDKSRALLTLEDLGFSPLNLENLLRVLKRPEGIIIVTGPTGSGKTTTLYAILNFINSMEVNIMTLEDPVEYELDLIRQSQVRENTRVNFSDGVRAILRQDPDIVLIGEIRDGETAQMALRAAMTGHQVFSTLHTNDALAAIPRLLDLDLKPGLLAGSIIASMAQRLVRKLCLNCKTSHTAFPDECQVLGVDPENPPEVNGAVGCPSCRDTGYSGRIGIVELIPIDEDLDAIIAAGGGPSQLKDAARTKGYKSMAEDGIDKVLAGTIDIPSLIRAVDMTSRL